MFANTNHQNLISHLISVGKVSAKMAEDLGLPPEVITECKYAGYFHDIGKAIVEYQNSVNQKSFETHPVKHHELSWFFINSTTQPPKARYRESFNRILNVIYWHHAKPLDEEFKSLNNGTDISNKIDFDSVIEQIRVIVNQLKEYDESLIDFIDNDDAVPTTTQTPTMWLTYDANNENSNPKLMAVRSCVIAADRFVSKLSAIDCERIVSMSDTELSSYLASEYTPTIQVTSYTKPDFYDESRFNIQEKCAIECLNEKTVVVHAPAGFGKTGIIVLNTLNSGKRTLVVCPRNSIAEAVYENIIRELQNLDANLSVELFLTSQRKNSYNQHLNKLTSEEFTSDIVVTNIDNLLKPMVSNEVADRMQWSMISNVVFDEFHELVTDSSLFSAFIYFMRLRHRLCSKAHTLLLSATPTNMDSLWNDDVKTIHYPSKTSHYPAVHNIPYKITFSESMPSKVHKGGVTIFNSIRNAQTHYSQYQTDVLAHSRFTDADKKAMLKTVYDNFGKQGTGVASGLSVSSAPIIQAAMDISFNNITESVHSPESSLQRPGRVNRWAELNDASIEVCCPSNKSETGAIANNYSVQLKNLWFNYYRNAVTSEYITLDEMYQIYNSFYVDHGNEVKQFINRCFINGTEHLTTMCPVKPITESTNEKISKSLRTPDGSFYVTMRRDDTNQWLQDSDLISVQRRDAVTHIENLQRTDVKVPLRELANQGFESFDKLLRRIKNRKYIKNDEFLLMARLKDTPVPVIDCRYDPKLGVYSNTDAMDELFNES